MNTARVLRILRSAQHLIDRPEAFAPCGMVTDALHNPVTPTDPKAARYSLVGALSAATLHTGLTAHFTEALNAIAPPLRNSESLPRLATIDRLGKTHRKAKATLSLAVQRVEHADQTLFNPLR